MKLTGQHLVELVLFEGYTDKFGHATVTQTSSEMDELVKEGLIQKDEAGEVLLFHLSITAKGRKFIKDIGYVAVISALAEYEAWHIIPLCESKLTLADLPVLLASDNERVRRFAQRKYMEFQVGSL